MRIMEHSQLSVYETFNQISSSEEATIYWGKYGRLALSCLKEQAPDVYVKLVMTNKLTPWVHETNEWLTAHRLRLLNKALDAAPLPKEASIKEIADHHIKISASLEETITMELINKIQTTSFVSP